MGVGLTECEVEFFEEFLQGFVLAAHDLELFGGGMEFLLGFAFHDADAELQVRALEFVAEGCENCLRVLLEHFLHVLVVDVEGDGDAVVCQLWFGIFHAGGEGDVFVRKRIGISTPFHSQRFGGEGRNGGRGVCGSRCRCRWSD